MNNYFIIHGSFGNSNEHYLPWLKKQLEKQGEVVCLDFPIGVNIQNYKNWAKTLDPYKNKINKNSIFITRSIGCVFAIKYIIQINLHIKKLVSISGFNNYFVNDDITFNIGIELLDYDLEFEFKIGFAELNAANLSKFYDIDVETGFYIYKYWDPRTRYNNEIFDEEGNVIAIAGI